MVNPVLRVQIIDKDDKVIAESWDCGVASRAWALIDASLTRKPNTTVSDAYINNLERENVRLDQEVDEAGKKY